MDSEKFVATVIDDGRASAQSYLVVGLCLLLNMLDGFDITAMAVVAGSVSSELSLSPDQLGWIFSFALAGMVAGALLLAPAADIVGRRTLIVASAVLVGVAILLTARASSLGEFVALRLIAGIGAGAMLASQATLTAEYSPSRYRSLAVAVVTAGYGMGAMMTSVAASFILPEHGWRGMFWFGGGLTLLMAIVAYLFIPESLKYLLERRPANALSRVNRVLRRLRRPPLAALPAGDVPGTQRSGLASTLPQLIAPEYRRITVYLWLAFFLSFVSLYFLMSWIPKLMEDAGFDAQAGRDAFFLFNLGGVIGVFVLGALSTRLMLTKLICISLLLAALGMIVFAMVPEQLTALFVIIFLVGALQQGGFVGLYSAAAKAYPTTIRSTGIGWSMGLGRSGAVVGPAAAGYLIAAGLGMAANFIVFAIPMVLAAVFAYRLHIR
jgi:benzoate transport